MNKTLLPAEVGHFMLLVASVSMIATPFVAQAARKLSASVEQHTGDAAGDLKARLGDLQGHVIIAGFGRVGEIVARLLAAEQVPYVAFDRDIDVVTKHRAQGRMIYFGDVARRELLHRARADSALAVVLTLDDATATTHMVESIKKAWPKLPLLVRTRDAVDAIELLRIGATYVVPETVESSLQLAGRVLASLGVPESVVDQRIDRERQRITAVLTSGAAPTAET